MRQELQGHATIHQLILPPGETSKDRTTFLEVLEKLGAGSYATATDFATDVEQMNEAWLTADVEALTASLDIAYPTDYLLAESWERLRRVFYFLDNLNAGANKIKIFAAVAMTFDEAKTLKELLRSKFGEETWLTLSAEIQDANCLSSASGGLPSMPCCPAASFGELPTTLDDVTDG